LVQLCRWFPVTGRAYASLALGMSIGGGKTNIPHEGARYSAVYEIDGPHVLVSPEWAKAGEAGRWPTQVRPYTRNRRHALYKVL
jgi:hypothetical protein